MGTANIFNEPGFFFSLVTVYATPIRAKDGANSKKKSETNR